MAIQPRVRLWDPISSAPTILAGPQRSPYLEYQPTYDRGRVSMRVGLSYNAANIAGYGSPTALMAA